MSLGTGIRKAAGLGLCIVFLACVSALPANARNDAATSTSTSKTKKAHTSAASTKTRTATSKRRKKSSRVRGQQKIDSQRVQSIQEALIREHYLRGEATGKWDQASEEAMRRYQADNGWQNKTVPDSRALI
jgi:peptidoglycan hydrolase-like protein with peptidoglycan-binding domain